MRIFFVTNNYTPYSGGVTNSVLAITNALRQQGSDFAKASSDRLQVFIITLDFAPQIQHDPSYVIRINCPIKFTYKKNYMAIPWRPTHAIKKLVEHYKPDIIHIQHPFLLGVSALKAAQTYNIPCVFTYHTMYQDYAHYVPLPRALTRYIISVLVKRFCNKVNGIIAPSSAIKDYLLSCHITTPITIIPSPLRPLFLTKPPIKLPPTNNSFKLLVVSRFVPEKNIPFVFDVFKQLPDSYTLTLVGYGSDYEKLQQLAFMQLHLSPERVRFIHQPNQDELLNYYRTADLFIFSSTTDTQGIVLAESMSQGVPVVAIDGPGQRDIIINGYNGFIVKNAQEAATTIINIAHDKALYNHLIAGAFATAEKYHPSVITQQLLDFYHTIISCYYK